LCKTEIGITSIGYKGLGCAGRVYKAKTPARCWRCEKKLTRLPSKYYTLEVTFCQEENRGDFRKLWGWAETEHKADPKPAHARPAHAAPGSLPRLAMD